MKRKEPDNRSSVVQSATVEQDIGANSSDRYLRFREALAGTLLRPFLNARMTARLRGGRVTCVLVRTPSGLLNTPVLLELRRRGFEQVAIFDLPARGKAPDLDVDLQGRGLTFIVASAHTALPKAATAAADVRFDLGKITAKVVAKALRTFTGETVDSKIHWLNFDLLSLEEILACVPSGISARDAIRKLQRAVKEKAKSSVNGGRLPSLDNAVGYGEARAWALNLREDLEDYRRGHIKWRDVDRGAVFVGPPGTGKTLLAQIVAASCRVPLVQSSIASLFASTGGYLNEVIKAQREIFAEAAQKAPSILFLDELDSLPNRATNNGRNRDYWQPVINDFLMLLDSASAEREGVVVIGATNRVDDIDSAILRPGRLERMIWIGPPSPIELAAILRHYLKGELNELDLVSLCSLRNGATGAQAEEWVRAARRLARRADRPLIEEDLIAQIEVPDHRPVEVLRRIAIHEAGHAIVSLALRRGELVSLTINRSGDVGGNTIVAVAPSIATLAEIETEVLCMLAGRAAEQALLGEDPSLAAAHDQMSATKLIAAAHASFGMGGDLTSRASPEEAARLLELDDRLRQRVAADLQRLMSRSRSIVVEHLGLVGAVAKELQQRKTLSGMEVRALAMSRSKEFAV